LLARDPERFSATQRSGSDKVGSGYGGNEAIYVYMDTNRHVRHKVWPTRDDGFLIVLGPPQCD
jgi:hypothetical protein